MALTGLLLPTATGFGLETVDCLSETTPSQNGQTNAGKNMKAGKNTKTTNCLMPTSKAK